jgi:hypothetical protein
MMRSIPGVRRPEEVGGHDARIEADGRDDGVAGMCASLHPACGTDDEKTANRRTDGR